MESEWLKEALFNGQTSNGFKLGTVLSLGWFWLRAGGGSVLYRGASMELIDFENILAVGEQDASSISPPGYVQHSSGSTYYYVVRRANNCGCQEYTVAAAVKVSIDADGELAQPEPNSVFGAKVWQVAGSKIQLLWFYCPLEQQSAPVCFKIYCDGGTGHIDYEDPIATIDYTGRKFYSYQSDTLDAGTYLFAIGAEDAGGVDDSSLAGITIQLDVTSPIAIEILSSEAV